ncbi:hypothetical protein Droror1_Dr00024036 [Drosera rotundifolia]
MPFCRRRLFDSDRRAADLAAAPLAALQSRGCFLDRVYAATIFGNALRLESLKPEKKLMWKKEMDCLLSVCDYIVELVPPSVNEPELEIRH